MSVYVLTRERMSPSTNAGDRCSSSPIRPKACSNCFLVGDRTRTTGSRSKRGGLQQRRHRAVGYRECQDLARGADIVRHSGPATVQPCSIFRRRTTPSRALQRGVNSSLWHDETWTAMDGASLGPAQPSVRGSRRAGELFGGVFEDHRAEQQAKLGEHAGRQGGAVLQDQFFAHLHRPNQQAVMGRRLLS